MTQLRQIFLACLLAQRVHTLTQKVYRPCGPKMCESLHYKQVCFTAWDFDEVHLVCKLTVSKRETENHDNRSCHPIRSEETKHPRTRDPSLHGFLMQTMSTLFHVDVKLRRKRKVSLPYTNLVKYAFHYDNKVLYMADFDDGTIFQGAIRNRRVKSTLFTKLKVKEVSRLVVDRKNDIVVIINNSPSLAIECHSTFSTESPWLMSRQDCDVSEIGIDKQQRVIYFVQGFKLCSMDYSGKNMKIFDKIKLIESFFIEFKDEHIFCISHLGNNMVQYKISRNSGETNLRKTSLNCGPQDSDMFHSVSKGGHFIIAAYENTRGLVTVKGFKGNMCRWRWKNMHIFAVYLLN